MNRLFKIKQELSISTNSNKNKTNYDDLIKKSIITQLANTIKEIQYCGIDNGDDDGNLDNKSNDNLIEASNNLCVIVEAIFLHGLKDSLTSRFRRAITDFNEQPEPNFWSSLLVISHRQIIDQITNLKRIKTEVGQCRAWIRLALNDCLLSSYLILISQNKNTMKSYYKTNSFILDTDTLDVAKHLIEGIEQLKLFTLPYNSAILNKWSLPSLYLAGIWSPTLKTCPISKCDDVTQIMLDKSQQPTTNSDSDTCSLNSAMSIASENSTLRQMVGLNEDEVLKIILSDKIENEHESLASSLGYYDKKNLEISTNNLNLIGKRKGGGWSSFEENQTIINNKPNSNSSCDDLLDQEIDDNLNVDDQSANNNHSNENSFHALIQSYNLNSANNFIKTPDIREVWQKFEEQRLSENSSMNNNAGETDESSGIDLEISDDSKTELLLNCIGLIATEKGLDQQNYECANCHNSLEINQKLNVCAFTGEYYCNQCMSTESSTIPSRIIHNWDFKSYNISLKSQNYINEIENEALIDLKVLNPFIYRMINELAELQLLRTQLNFLRAYLYTCRENVIEEFQKQIGTSKQYMYEHIHLYSISDLVNIRNGNLIRNLQTVVDFGRQHVIGCWLCSQKGFVCEICNKSKVLFPFDVKNVYRCEICNAVYHQKCLDASRPCPKCERRKKREDLPLLGATVE